MLKIKDEISEEESEKFRLFEYYDLETGKFRYITDKNCLIEADENRIIQTNIRKGGLDLIYDLIQAGLVEKVDDKK